MKKVLFGFLVFFLLIPAGYIDKNEDLIGNILTSGQCDQLFNTIGRQTTGLKVYLALFHDFENTGLSKILSDNDQKIPAKRS